MSYVRRAWSPRGVRHVTNACTAVVVGVAFWVAVFLPFAYLAVVATPAVDHLDGTVVLWGAVANAVALVVGHRHDPTRSESTATERRDGEER